ncbi:MAG: sigma 54-interacting transcriptional regulator [Pseudomonadota bacterium]
MKNKSEYSGQGGGRHQEASDKLSLNEEGMVVLDNELMVLSFNWVAGEIFGPKLKHGEKIALKTIITRNHLAAIENAMEKALLHGETQIDLKAEMETKSHRPSLILYSTYPLYATKETILGVILSFKILATPSGSDKTAAASFDFKNVNATDSIFGIEQRFLLDDLPEGVFTINTKWRIASFNRTAETITGYARENVLGCYCWEIFHSDLCDLGCPLRTALETGKTAMDQDVRILKKGGEHQTILVNAGVLRDAQGLIIGAVETFRRLTGEIKSSNGMKENHPFSVIIGKSKSIKRLFSILPDIAASEANVFITGESGTGKELFARTIHYNSSRAKSPFMAVNCSALAETLLESELFGHEKSAFTGATKTKLGRFELVKRGTLFLDEIAELKPSLQIKLLRVIEQREFERVGGTTTIPLEARIISATNRNLSQALENGSFREDFYYRLRTVPLMIPPLRERKDDIPLLTAYFIQCFNSTFKKKVRNVAPEVMELFISYHWPGNVRELERTIEHAFVFVKGPMILYENLPQMEVFTKAPKSSAEIMLKTEKKLNKQAVVKALRETNGQKNKAAQLLGISRTSLWRKMKAYDLLN